VLALGGGAVTSAETRDALVRSGVPVVVLRAQLRTLRTRVGDTRTRPVLGTDPDARLAELAAQRAPLYAEIATFGIDTDGRTPGQVAAAIAARLHARGALV
jgi:shikimate kinase